MRDHRACDPIAQQRWWWYKTDQLFLEAEECREAIPEDDHRGQATRTNRQSARVVTATEYTRRNWWGSDAWPRLPRRNSFIVEESEAKCSTRCCFDAVFVPEDVEWRRPVAAVPKPLRFSVPEHASLAPCVASAASQFEVSTMRQRCGWNQEVDYPIFSTSQTLRSRQTTESTACPQ